MMAKVDPNRTNSTERDPCPFEPYTSTEKAFQSIAYFIIMFGSFIGNVLVICVVILNRQMRTVTNYLIVNMAVANLFITTFTMPVTVKALATGRGINWSNGFLYDLLCKIIPFSQAMSIASSVLSLTVIAVDRFLAVMYPMKTFVTIQKTYGAIALIWFVGILANSPTLYAQKIVYLERSQRWTCVEIWEPAFIEGGYKAFTIVLFVFFYLFPLLTMSILYSCVIYKLWVRKVPGNQTSENQQRSNKSRKKVLKMLLAVVILFAVCRFPVYITQFIRFFGEEDFPCGAPKTLAFMGYFLGHANSVIDPVIYAIFNSDFRKGFRNVLLCHYSRRSRVAPQVNIGTVIGRENCHVADAIGLSPIRTRTF